MGVVDNSMVERVVDFICQYLSGLGLTVGTDYILEVSTWRDAEIAEWIKPQVVVELREPGLKKLAEKNLDEVSLLKNIVDASSKALPREDLENILISVEREASEGAQAQTFNEEKEVEKPTCREIVEFVEKLGIASLPLDVLMNRLLNSKEWFNSASKIGEVIRTLIRAKFGKPSSEFVANDLFEMVYDCLHESGDVGTVSIRGIYLAKQREFYFGAVVESHFKKVWQAGLLALADQKKTGDNSK